jgi:hypothetical protein
MTHLEILEWVNSPASFGWLVRTYYIGDLGNPGPWRVPQQFHYDGFESVSYKDGELFTYERGMVKDGCIIKKTICGFEIYDT